MKIALIGPSRNKTDTYYSNHPPLMRFFSMNNYVPGFFHPNLALLTVAALTPQEFEVKLIDERVDMIDFQEKFDIVGISMMTAQALRGYEIADRFMDQGAHVVLGGIHASVMPEEAKAHCDTLIIGEAERNWPHFLEGFQMGDVEEIYEDHSVDLQESPIPRYELVDTSIFHLLPIQTTRGCPHDCSFCSVTTVFGPRYRVKSIEQILEEMDAVRHYAKNRRCVFNDDNMFVDRKRAYEILENMKSLKMKYFAQTDISIAEDEKFMNLLAESGCKTLFIGFESLVPENLVELQRSKWKFKRLQKYSESCQKIQSYGIQVLGSFVVGFDHDTRDSLLLTRDFVLENHIWAQFLFLTPFPGTRVRKELLAQKRLATTETNWDLYTCFDAIFEPENMKIEELEDTVLEIYESVYSDSAHRRRIRRMVEQLKTRPQDDSPNLA